MQLVPVHLDLPLLNNLHTRMCDVVPCDRIVQRTYCFVGYRDKRHWQTMSSLLYETSHCRASLAVATLISFGVKLANQKA